jgi:hypothetical protein
MGLSQYDIIKHLWKDFKNDPYYIEKYYVVANITLDFRGSLCPAWSW